MVENIEPVGEDFSKSIEDLAEHAGEVALDIYRAQLNGAKNVMMDAGCPLDICDLLANAAINGYNSFVKENPDGDPMEAFDAAGEFVSDALDSEFRKS